MPDPDHEQEPKLSPGIAFRLQPDGSWSPEKLPHNVLDKSEFSGHLTINGYRCSVFEMPDLSMWAQKSVNTPATPATPATASSKGHPEPDMSKKCPECGEKVEMLSNELQTTCPKCGFTIFDDVASCVQWCKYAEECVGTEMYKKLKKETPAVS